MHVHVTVLLPVLGSERLVGPQLCGWHQQRGTLNVEYRNNSCKEGPAVGANIACGLGTQWGLATWHRSHPTSTHTPVATPNSVQLARAGGFRGVYMLGL